MIARDWIFETLGMLDLRYWPIFLWELYWLDRYLDARRAEHSSGLIGFAVCKKGRVYITLQAFGDEPSQQADWTDFAPRAPWQRLAPGSVVQRLLGTAANAHGCINLIPDAHQTTRSVLPRLMQHNGLLLQPP
ncbi:hypothetical protein [Henriciella marina]|uniref:hypothetical protein n=1 Tax=Henriciella marina TaxID=453851 RepID=UPI00037434FF|nr:hypothetical protein [Henriciella marina]